MTKEGLTAKQVEHTKANADKRMEIPVGLPKGLYLVVHQTGRKSWAFRYRWHGRPSKLTFGTYPEVSLAAARAESNAAIEALEAGNDPAAVRANETPRKPTSAEAVAKEWIERDLVRTETACEVERVLNKDVLPNLKGKLITEIARPDLMRLLDKIADRGTLSARNHALSYVKRWLNWTVQRGYLTANPAATIEPLQGEQSRDRVLTEEELRDVWCAAPALGYPSSPFLQVLLLTAQRRGEVAGMRWDDVNLDKGEWTIPKEETKSGRAHEVPLSKQIVEILRVLPRFAGPFVFTTTSGMKPINGFSKMRKYLDAEIAKRHPGKAAGGDDGFTIHDLRRTAATWLAQSGVPPHVLAAILNHSPGTAQGITAVYNRFRYGPERREALEQWAAYVGKLETQKARKAS